MKVTLRQKRNKSGYSLYLDIYHKGKRTYEYLNLYLTADREQNKETKQLAKRIRTQREIELQNDLHGFTFEAKLKTEVTQWIIKTYEGNPFYKTVTEHLKAYSKGTLTFQNITPRYCEGFKEYLSRTVSENTARQYFALFKAAINRAVKQNIIRQNPAKNTTLPKSKDKKREFLTIEEVSTLAGTDCHNPEIKKAFLLSCFTGLRLSDIEGLKWGHIQGDEISILQQKTQQTNIIPLSESAKRILDKGNIHPLPNQKVFSLPSRPTIMHTLRSWFKAAKITKPAKFHLSRHTFATLSITQGIDIYTVSKLLGHSELATTQIYAKVIDQKKRDAMKLLPVIENIG